SFVKGSFVRLRRHMVQSDVRVDFTLLNAIPQYLRRIPMKRRSWLSTLVVVGLGVALGYAAATANLANMFAQAKQPPGGSTVLPRPEPSFQGKIGRTAKDSTPDFPKPIAAPKGAPNVLL